MVYHLGDLFNIPDKYAKEAIKFFEKREIGRAAEIAEIAGLPIGMAPPKKLMQKH